jgi:DNA polymerase-3 subunit gamma/tau
MDAASRTGIGDIREILDSVRYAPVMARYKLYIIDEVHMLSAAAFNGLLKTLEEPPPHVKFIFATTEIRKVPVTVLSRCQRFDLKRIAPERLAAHLSSICERERIAVEPDGLALIARAAEGSARDALSLLDQAMVQKTGGAITAPEIRDMLGMADRGRTLDLFAALAQGDVKFALTEIRSQYDSGADPALILRDLLEIGHEAARAQALGAGAHIVGGADWEAKIRGLAAALSPAQLSRLWQMLLKALEDAARAPDPIAAAEMAVVRLCAASTLPPPEDAARLLREPGGGNASGPPGADRGASAPAGDAANPVLNSFEDVVALIARERAISLEIDVERYVRLSSFEPGRIVFAPAAGAPRDLAPRLARALTEWTGQTWEVRADGESEVESLAERRARERKALLEDVRKHPLVADALKAFPGAEIVDVRDPPPTQAAQVIDMPAKPVGRRKKEG